MTRAYPQRFLTIFCAIAAAFLFRPAHAEERVTLQNQAVYVCAHHAVIGGETRLYFDSSDANYQDILTERIASIATFQNAGSAPVVPTPSPAAAEPNAAPTRTEIDSLLAGAGALHDIDAELLASVVKIESDFRVNAKSRAGARGLMQLMPATAREQGVSDLSRVDQNIAGGAAYLDALLKRYHDDAVLALAAYNAGPGAVDHYRGLPPYRETRWYVYRVIREYNRRKELQSAHAVVAAR